MNASIITYTLPAHWASYLINGDDSGIDEVDKQAADAWLHSYAIGSPVSCSDEAYFRRSNDATSYGGNVLEYTFFRRFCRRVARLVFGRPPSLPFSGTKVEFGFGVGLDKAWVPINGARRDKALCNIIAKATELFSGCTVTDTYGTWRDDSGKLFEERGKTLMVMLTGGDRKANTEKVETLVAVIKHELDQQAVVVSVTPISIGFL